MTPKAPILVDRRRIVPGELRHLELKAGERGFDPVAMVLGWLGRQHARKKPLVCRPFGVCTWGVSSAERAQSWDQIAAIGYRRLQRGSRDNPVLFSQIEVELDNVVWRGEREVEVILDVLADIHPLLAHDARREISLGLAVGAPSERVRAGLFEELLRNAREWLRSPEGKEETSLVSGEYRTLHRDLRPDFLTELEIALVGRPGNADRGAFAAIVAAELGVRGLQSQLAAMTTAPSAFLSAVAIGAALRLGISPIRVGKPEHVEPFIDTVTARAIAAWAAGA